MEGDVYQDQGQVQIQMKVGNLELGGRYKDVVSFLPL